MHRIWTPLWIVFFSVILNVFAIPVDIRDAKKPYAPYISNCPTNVQLTRPANSISDDEALYSIRRKAKASIALTAWLKKINPNLPTSNLPTIGLSTSGGGYRSLLTGAGVLRAFDGREDTHLATSGLLQSLTYSSSLSGGAWLTSSVGGNGFPTISSLQNGLWKKAFQSPFFMLMDEGDPLQAYHEIISDINSKMAAGFEATLTDLWGRLLSYQLLRGTDGGVAARLSDAPETDYWKSYEAPYPIITALGVNRTEGLCKSNSRSIQYEFHPYEFSSWDPGVAAFTRTKYLGTAMRDGKPVIPGICIQNLDNLGHVFGTSSNLFDELCVGSNDRIEALGKYFPSLKPILNSAQTSVNRVLYSMYPNPWKGSAGSPLVQNDMNIYLVDGGLSMENNPIWPLLHPHRPIDVIIINDNSADTKPNYPNGSELRRTYEQASESGMTRMPFIPTADIFVSEGMDRRGAFFGCDEKEKITLVWLPNAEYTFKSGTATLKLQYTPPETDGMIDNAMHVATQGNDPQWSVCLGCAIVLKTGEPTIDICKPCLAKYCYRENG